jgi:iron complex outermembrane recepter protein
MIPARPRLLGRMAAYAGAPLLIATLSGAHAQTGVIEEIVVTGSYIRGTPEDAALPVEVTTRADLEDVGMPSVNELIRNLSITSGNLSESNQFVSNGAEGVSTINLRGLGAARTLVLINGRRHVPTETTGVDMATLPFSAIGRIEVLKDGAAALYGSDAIAGVVNLITRSGFEGFEIRASHQFIDDTDGEQDVNLVYGWADDRMSWMIAGEWQRRSELNIKDRNWALRPFADNPAGGWSSIGMPGRVLPRHPAAASPTNPLGFLGDGADPNCDLLGGTTSGTACFFQYTFYDNLIEDQDTYKVYSEFNWDINDTTRLHVEALYSKMEMDEWKTSPSYPPQSLFGPDRYVAPSHPGLQLYKEQNPGVFPDLSAVGLPVAVQGAFLVSRMIGVDGLDGQPQTAKRETETLRLAVGLSGSLFNDAVGYDFSVSYSERERFLNATDMYVERMAFALDGLGGPNCDPATGTPGVGGCLYFNPFGNSIERSAVTGALNPDFQQTYNGFRIDNPRELLDWLVGTQELTFTNKLAVYDAVFNGETGISLPGGTVGWAAGVQVRDERFERKYADINDLTVTPCPFNDPMSIVLGNTTTLDCTSPTGPLAFLAGATPDSTRRRVYGLFAELALPISDTIDAQLAVRVEDYGGNVGSTVDPKFAARWQATDWLALRGSVSTTFRGPPQSFLGGRQTALQFVIPANAFKAIDTLGNPSLDPESALATNLGFIVKTDQFYGSVDWWRFDFEDPFQTESFGQIVAAYQAQGCFDGGAGAPTPDAVTEFCTAMRDHVFPLGVAPTGIERVEVSVLNGSDIVTSGIDFFAEYFMDDVLSGDLSFGVQGSWVLEYDSDDFREISGQIMAPGGDFVGLLNTGLAPFTPIPELQGHLFAKFSIGGHRLNYVMRYVDSYKDARASTLDPMKKIDSHVTHDLHYNWSLMNDDLLLSVSAINLTDKDPPRAQLDMNYDPFTHNPFGRMVKLGVRYNLGGR